MPLGVGGVPHSQATHPLPSGATLLLYTDGLVETPDSDIGDQIDTLHTQACTIIPTASGLDQAADSILSALLPYSGEPADDVTLLLVRTPGAPRASAGTMIYPGPQHVAGGRRFVRDTLHAWNQAELAPTACLLVSELLTNAMRHTSEPIGLRLHHTEHEIIAEISDDHPQLPRLDAAGTGRRRRPRPHPRRSARRPVGQPARQRQQDRVVRPRDRRRSRAGTVLKGLHAAGWLSPPRPQAGCGDRLPGLEPTLPAAVVSRS